MRELAYASAVSWVSYLPSLGPPAPGGSDCGDNSAVRQWPESRESMAAREAVDE